MRSVEVEARTVDEAVEEALARLGASRDEVEITVLEEGSKGLFGILGSRGESFGRKTSSSPRS